MLFRSKNLEEFISVAKTYEKENSEENGNDFNAFLEFISLSSDINDQADPTSINDR